MITGNDLHGGRQLHRNVTHEFVQPLNGFPVVVVRRNAVARSTSEG